jgi:CheY-like chemotaxis protein
MRVLIVDDDHDIREAMSETLEMEGHRTHCAANGREALEALRREEGARTCVILLDLMMPVMNGWEFREEQRRDERLAAIPVVVITADAEAREKAARLEASGVLRKPIRGEDLVRTVEKYCPATRA